MRILVATFVLAAFLVPLSSAQFSEGDLYIGSYPDSIYHVDPQTWTVDLFANRSNGLAGTSAVAFSPWGTLLTSNYETDEILEFDSTGRSSVLYGNTWLINGPFGENGLVFDQEGNLFVSNYNVFWVVRYPAGGGEGEIYVHFGDGLIYPDGLATTLDGTLYVANRNGFDILMKEAGRGSITVVFDTLPDNPFSILARANGDIYVACMHGPIYRYPGGDAAARELFLDASPNDGNPAMQFSLDETVIYYTSQATGNLLAIDPDRAATHELLPPGSLPGGLSIAVAGERCAGGFFPYGTGTAGAGGLVPSLDGVGRPHPGGAVLVQIRDFVGGAPSALVVASAPGEEPALGGTLYVDLATAVLWLPVLLPGTPGVPGVGDLDLAGRVPPDPDLSCLHIYAQHLAIDGAAPGGVSMTDGLDIWIGK